MLQFSISFINISFSSTSSGLLIEGSPEEMGMLSIVITGKTGQQLKSAVFSG